MSLICPPLCLGRGAGGGQSHGVSGHVEKGQGHPIPKTPPPHTTVTVTTSAHLYDLIKHDMQSKALERGLCLEVIPSSCDTQGLGRSIP